jgi:hypothetical protein
MSPQRAAVQAAIANLESTGVVLEAGLTSAEVGAVETALAVRLPADLRLFLQTALPVTGGFPNWRHANLDRFRNHSAERADGVLFDVEHNRLWPAAWGSRPTSLEDTLAEARRRLASAPRLIPVRGNHYLPIVSERSDNPVLSVRQGDVRVVGRDLLSYLGSYGRGGECSTVGSGCDVPFWGELGLGRRVGLPDFVPADHCDHAGEFERFRQLAEPYGVEVQAGEVYWPIVWFSRPGEEAVNEQGRPLFGFYLRDAGWLIHTCPTLYFVPDRHRIADLCRFLFDRWPAAPAGELPRLRLSEDLRVKFRLVTVAHDTFRRDGEASRAVERERRGWRNMGDRQEDDVWGEYGARFGYPAERDFHTPTPSATWDISPIYLRTEEDFTSVEDNLTRKALAALRRCTRPGEELHVLDWNHPCYFLDPHAAADDGESWPIPVLPNGDHYIFLAPDLRFGLIGNCVEQTICVFGRELLEALADDPPLLFRKPAPTAEEWERLRIGWAALGWQRLNNNERGEYRDGFYEAFDFAPHRRPENDACFREPAPSVT